MTRARVLDIVVIAALATMPYWLAAIGGYTELASRIVVMGLAAMSLNFLLGYTGVLSFGHAAYFGLGGYGAAMAIKYLGWGTLPAIALGAVVATVAAVVIGALIVRRRGVYFAMVTIAFGQVFYFIAFRWNAMTGGDDGLGEWRRAPIHFGFATLDIAGNDKAFYYFVLVVFAICAGAMALLIASPLGRSFIAIRENERRARFLGLAIDSRIWLSFVISCFFVSIAGALYALLNNFIDPRALRFDLSGNLVIMAVMGGMRSFWGPLFGAAIFVALQDFLSSRTENWMFLIGLVFVLVVRFFPRGLVGMLSRGGGMTLLKIANIGKRFGNLTAIDNVSLDVEPGELRAIIGPNGAGKTTFFNLISGLFAPSAGSVSFDGQDVTRLTPEARVRLGMSRTFQITEIFPELSVEDNLRVAVERAEGLSLSPWLGGAARRRVGARLDELLETGHLASKRGVRVGALSHGDQRAAEIMMALALKPRLLLLDEPTAGMGDQETYDVARLVRRLHRDAGLTIMLIEHDMRVVFNLADRIMVLAEGRVLAEGSPREIAADENVQRAYLGEVAS